jgi:biopolymer transport protein ExbD
MKNKKSLDFEINLLPVLSVLAVCISFLLLTTVWVRVGTFDLSQGFGTEGADSKKNPPSMWVHFDNDGTVQITVKDAAGLKDNLQMTVIRGLGTRTNVKAVETFAKKLKTALPSLNVALIMPAPSSSYEDMIAVMDKLRAQKIGDIGIAPL